MNFYDIAYQGFLWAAGPLDERGVGGLRGPRCRPGVNGGRLGGGLEPVHEAEVDELPVDNCIKIGLPGKSILREYFPENRTSRSPFLLLRIRGVTIPALDPAL